MRKDVRNDCEIALCEDEYEIPHKSREIATNSSELLEALHGEPLYDLNTIVADMERMMDEHVERIFGSEKEYREVQSKAEMIII